MEGLGISYEPVKPPPMDESEVIAILDDNLKKIEEMAEEYKRRLVEFRSTREDEYISDVPKFRDPLNESTRIKRGYDYERTSAFVNAEKRLAEYNDWPLYIAIIKMKIKLILLFTYKKLSHGKCMHYKAELEQIMETFKGYDSKIVGLKELSLESLIERLPRVVLMSHTKQSVIDGKFNDRIINRMSSLLRGGKTSRHRKSLRKHYTRKSKSNSNKSVAAAIKDISLAQARADFAALKAIPCADINQAAKVGNAAMDHYFFRHRLAAKTKRAVSYYDWIKTDWKRNEAELRLYRFNLAQGKTPEKARYGVFRLYYGAIHGFKPLIAKWLYCTYKPRTAVLDFSAGWGGRCLGAMALGIPYIGIDTNKDLRPAYERMVKELDDSDTVVTMRFQDAAATDFSQFKYDMVFTSPPYFKSVKPVEGYAHMPRYADRADFNARFLFPVIRATYAHLARGGTYALNIPADMYDELKAAGILPPLIAKHRLFLQPRFAKGNPKHPDTQYEEHIYVWKK